MFHVQKANCGYRCGLSMLNWIFGICRKWRGEGVPKFVLIPIFDLCQRRNESGGFLAV